MNNKDNYTNTTQPLILLAILHLRFFTCLLSKSAISYYMIVRKRYNIRVNTLCVELKDCSIYPEFPADIVQSQDRTRLLLVVNLC